MTKRDLEGVTFFFCVCAYQIMIRITIIQMAGGWVLIEVV